jgi:hypothetical protein
VATATASPAAGVASPAAGTGPTAVATRQVGTCEDGTSSSASSYAPRIQAMLAQAVAEWVPMPPADTGNGVGAQPGLHFVLRSVTTTSVSTDYPSVDATVPAVDALRPQPSPTDSSFNSEVHTWTDQESGWKRSAEQATAAAATLAGQVRAYQVARNTYRPSTPASPPSSTSSAPRRAATLGSPWCRTWRTTSPSPASA